MLRLLTGFFAHLIFIQLFIHPALVSLSASTRIAP